MLSDSLTWLSVVTFALAFGVWFKWWARRVSEEDEPPLPLAWPLGISGAFVLLLAGALLTDQPA